MIFRKNGFLAKNLETSHIKKLSKKFGFRNFWQVKKFLVNLNSFLVAPESDQRPRKSKPTQKIETSCITHELDCHSKLGSFGVNRLFSKSKSSIGFHDRLSPKGDHPTFDLHVNSGNKYFDRSWNGKTSMVPGKRNSVKESGKKWF